MPFGRESEGAVKALMNAQKEIGFSFVNGLILPEEQQELLRKVFMHNATKSKKLTEEELTIEMEKLGEISERIVAKLKECGGTIHPFVESEGGSKKDGADTTEYVILNINDILIFEPLGQVNNATLVGYAKNEAEKKQLSEALKIVGRKGAVEKGLLGRVFHKRTANATYDYDSGHIFDIMNMAINYPEEFVQNMQKLMKNQTSCSLDTISQRMKATTDIAVDSVGEQVKSRAIKINEIAKQLKEMGFSAEDITKAFEKLNEKKKEGNISAVEKGVEL